MRLRLACNLLISRLFQTQIQIRRGLKGVGSFGRGGSLGRALASMRKQERPAHHQIARAGICRVSRAEPLAGPEDYAQVFGWNRARQVLAFEFSHPWHSDVVSPSPSVIQEQQKRIDSLTPSGLRLRDLCHLDRSPARFSASRGRVSGFDDSNPDQHSGRGTQRRDLSSSALNPTEGVSASSNQFSGQSIASRRMSLCRDSSRFTPSTCGQACGIELLR
jgi:hypothetical protein